MKAFWKYTLARLALFLVTYVAIWYVTSYLRPQPPIDPFVLLAALIVSGAISIFALRGMRDEVAAQWSKRAENVTRAQQQRATDDLD